MPTEYNIGSEKIICHLGKVLFTIKLLCSMPNKSIKYYKSMQNNFSLGNTINFFSFLGLFLIAFNVSAIKSLSDYVFEIAINETNLKKVYTSVTTSVLINKFNS